MVLIDSDTFDETGLSRAGFEGDPIAEAFKLKCISFLEKEAKQVDKGEINLDV